MIFLGILLLGLMGMKWRVWKEKLLLVKSIRELDDKELAKQVLEQRIFMEWPGLGQEATKISQTIGLSNVSTEYVTKEEIKDHVRHHHNKSLEEEMKNMKKLEKLSQLDLRGTRPYLTTMKMEDGRMAWL